ncbi:MAG: hypothetical protein EP330_30625 [Deltaproteobacteria bacterium]|nr:MAG: hypothetical protein EP330_30625 [Deltaproteobacteria bacterium]
MTLARSLALMLILAACGSGSPEPVEAAAPAPAAKTLSPDNAEEATRRIGPLGESLTAAGAEVFSTGIGACWQGEGLCVQVEAKTGADEGRIRELATAALDRAGFTGTVEVRLFDANPRALQVGE